ncbi:hypothetical protein A2U01_0021067, partial [Trifolium medium]|nr:hypothetical protein [Trifolium medium]
PPDHSYGGPNCGPPYQVQRQSPPNQLTIVSTSIHGVYLPPIHLYYASFSSYFELCTRKDVDCMQSGDVTACSRSHHNHKILIG